MRALSSWMQQLGFLVLFAGLVELALPDSDVRKVVRLLVGLVIILAVVEPIAVFVEDGDWLERVTLQALIDDGREHLQAGEELARSFQEQAKEVWQRGAEHEIATMILLIDGIEDAEVRVYGKSPGEIDTVDVWVSTRSLSGNHQFGASAGEAISVSGGGDHYFSSDDFWSHTQEHVHRLVMRLVPTVDPRAVRVIRRVNGEP